MARRRRPGRSRRSLTIGLLVLASITIITLDYRGGGHSMTSALKRAAHDTFSPVQRGVDAVVRPIGSFLAGAVHYGSVEQQNQKLRHEIGQLQQEAISGRATRRTLATLEGLQHLPWVGSIKTVTAEVVALNTSNFVATVQLDAGTDRGIEDGMPVVGGSGLVGSVVESWSTGCTVRLISDPGSAVGIRFGVANYALAQGEGVGRTLSVNDVPPGTPGLYRGEVLMTSGIPILSYPPNIPVARVKSIVSSLSSTQEAVSAAPVADLGGLQYLDVMLWTPNGVNSSG